MTSANTLPYRVFQRDSLIAAFSMHDEAVEYCKDVANRTLVLFTETNPGGECIREPVEYCVKRYERQVFTCIHDPNDKVTIE